MFWHLGKPVGGISRFLLQRHGGWLFKCLKNVVKMAVRKEIWGIPSRIQKRMPLPGIVTRCYSTGMLSVPGSLQIRLHGGKRLHRKSSVARMDDGTLSQIHRCPIPMVQYQ